MDFYFFLLFVNKQFLYRFLPSSTINHLQATNVLFFSLKHCLLCHFNLVNVLLMFTLRCPLLFFVVVHFILTSHDLLMLGALRGSCVLTDARCVNLAGLNVTVQTSPSHNMSPERRFGKKCPMCCCGAWRG